MFPYLTFGLSAWGQAAQLHLNKLLLLQKRAIRFMNFSKPRTHAVPLFISSKILPINMLYFETMSTLMSNSIHPYKTRSSSSGNFYIQYSRLNQQRNSTTRFGARVWNCLPPQVRQLPKKQFKKKVREILFAIFHAEDTYVEAPLFTYFFSISFILFSFLLTDYFIVIVHLFIFYFFVHFY